MSTLIMLCGFFGTIIFVWKLWCEHQSHRPRAIGGVLGVLVAIVWPVSFWVALGLWWYWHGRPAAGSSVPARLAQAQAYQRLAQREGMPASAHYWTQEEQRLLPLVGTGSADGRTPRGVVVGVCAVGLLVTVSQFGHSGGPSAPVAPGVQPTRPVYSSVAPAPSNSYPPAETRPTYSAVPIPPAPVYVPPSTVYAVPSVPAYEPEARVPDVESERSHSAYYSNCAAARAAGAAPLRTGDPGYRAGLDRDSDGIACE